MGKIPSFRLYLIDNNYIIYRSMKKDTQVLYYVHSRGITQNYTAKVY